MGAAVAFVYNYVPALSISLQLAIIHTYHQSTSIPLGRPKMLLVLL